MSTTSVNGSVVMVAVYSLLGSAAILGAAKAYMKYANRKVKAAKAMETEAPFKACDAVYSNMSKEQRDAMFGVWSPKKG